MLANISKLLTVQLSPLLALVSTFLILFTFLGPVPIASESVALVTIVPGNSQTEFNTRALPENFIGHRVPRAAALAVVERAEAKAISGPTLRFGFLGSCTKPKSGDEKCTLPSLSPVYDTSALAKSTPFVQSPPQTSSQWMLLSLISLNVFLLLGSLATIPFMPKAVTNILTKPFAVRTVAWLGIIGWLAGMITTVVLRVSFGSSCDKFNGQAAMAGEQLVANVANGFTMLWIAFALAVPALICSLFKLQLEAKSA
ncbi:hypothetical protein FRB90_001199 [Tulasnella sp. 427]|nr:hypothetical protein FRB90_001199 [Tulasnella sp. 427]